ncbi:uncharacterized protein LACBIDRAFT_296676 [Laccaria bicolor S238N-H82]|uniref:Predicted protein n=1 Tax=Laccaria bicolor (strain S238N-H82 / ATCC MYA-4686) TaxID=486041 RepID=B0D9E3_LACBS|nr:uncharacterized protein LACBIDRAFT_296676 [Laccaria bicolor S238N-H82]EDR09001.1 predicted protein [Laccaria bicolor S238N-H82]|eukprot:XP_001880314.1 predicted protein [Laccaria bicolor S238N-H82]
MRTRRINIFSLQDKSPTLSWPRPQQRPFRGVCNVVFVDTMTESEAGSSQGSNTTKNLVLASFGRPRNQGDANTAINFRIYQA